jgi:hypothetical protein
MEKSSRRKSHETVHLNYINEEMLNYSELYLLRTGFSFTILSAK